MFGYVDAVEGVLVGLEQPTGVGRRAQQIGALAQGGVVFGRDQDGIAVLGDDLDGVVVFVDLLDQREEFFACLARGDRHDGQPSDDGTRYCTTARGGRGASDKAQPVRELREHLPRARAPAAGAAWSARWLPSCRCPLAARD